MTNVASMSWPPTSDQIALVALLISIVACWYSMRSARAAWTVAHIEKDRRNDENQATLDAYFTYHNMLQYVVAENMGPAPASKVKVEWKSKYGGTVPSRPYGGTACEFSYILPGRTSAISVDLSRKEAKKKATVIEITLTWEDGTGEHSRALDYRR
ncbi:hypothetical protein OHS70_05400 [Streptomyces sp. NBC_00390]|uniref:hypothetical protein n=1 Tax=Streptomyces sp. NBC_00390 TaxID=2975736 RepID=UPI002E1C46F9